MAAIEIVTSIETVTSKYNSNNFKLLQLYLNYQYNF